MTAFMVVLLLFLVVCAIAVSFCKDTLNAILIFMVYSVVMSVIWMLLESPDLAITEAAVGAGVTSVLFFLTLKKLEKIDADQDQSVQDWYEQTVKEEEDGLI